MTEAFIVDGIRSAIGNHCGALAGVRADDLAATVIRALTARHRHLDPAAVEDVILGCANQAGEDNRNVARMAGLLAGLPVSVPGQTVNRLCASGMTAVVDAARAIKAGDGALYIAGGVEQMTRAPWVLAKTSTAFARNPEIFDTSIGWRFVNPKMKDQFGIDSMGQTAENVAEQFRISRDDQDRFAVASHEKASQARSAGRFAPEICPVQVSAGKNEMRDFSEDEFIRPGTTAEVLGRLKPAFRTDGKGTVTAGNSSGINDGAAALLVASEDGIKSQKLTPIARIVGSAAAGVEPRVMGVGPVPAVQKLLKQSKVSLDAIDVIELNEAFAAQSLACLRELKIDDDDPRVNPNGGAIALGHPLGMSGARLLLTAALELQQRKKRYALCSMCVGVGQGLATLIERV